MFGIETSTLLIAVLVIAAIVIAYLFFRGDPAVESPRSQMDVLEGLLRERGFFPLLHAVRNFEKFKEDDFLIEIQRLLVAFSQDREFVEQWLKPILLANLGMIIKNPDLLRTLDAHLRQEYGYRIKPIRHVTYGVKPEVQFHTTTEDGDVCFRENLETKIARGEKIYKPLSEDDASETQGEF